MKQGARMDLQHRIDQQGIVLVLAVAVLATVLISTALRIGLN
jgi:hypothetical protein